MKPTTLKQLDPIARRIGLYTSYTLDEAEYIGKAQYALPGIQRPLLDGGYETPPTFMGIPLAAAKEHPETGQVHDWTYRTVDEDNPRMQYHVHGFHRDYQKGPEHAYEEIYSHYEFRPDFKPVGEETTSEMIERLRTHYRPDYTNGEYIQGKADPTLRGLVE
jgi:hypothetical protein